MALAQPPLRRVTSTDVARAVGLSRTTVSYVLNETPGQKIPEITRRRVLDAAASLGYAPSAAAVEMAEAIFNDRKKILPCAAYLEGEYGIKGLFVGVPVVLGAKGIEKIIELKLTPEESAALKKSADAVQELVGLLKA